MELNVAAECKVVVSRLDEIKSKRGTVGREEALRFLKTANRGVSAVAAAALTLSLSHGYGNGEVGPALTGGGT